MKTLRKGTEVTIKLFRAKPVKTQVCAQVSLKAQGKVNAKVIRVTAKGERVIVQVGCWTLPVPVKIVEVKR